MSELMLVEVVLTPEKLEQLRNLCAMPMTSRDRALMGLLAFQQILRTARPVANLTDAGGSHE
ncbi:hypothetical protein [Microbulbifer sp. VVAC002]|uniref:hypothetical protein n=1 Tax=Microbulbifer sp. VVAC002 TaxID=3243387 RepID=UPI00403A3D43